LNSAPDIHYQQPEWKFKIQRVGAVRVPLYAPLQLAAEECAVLPVLIDAFVDLPETLRGLHVSRTIRSIESSVQLLERERERKPCRSIFELASQICNLLLEEHEYASESAVSLKTHYPIEGQLVKIEYSMTMRRDGSREASLVLGFMGITACPSAKALYSFYERSAYNESPTHTQRATLKVALKLRGEAKIPMNVLYETLKQAFPATPIASLGRVEEYRLVKSAIAGSMFTEDVARKAAWLVLTRIAPMLQVHGSAIISVESMESVHPYNLKATLKVSW